jgi:vancomycin resistance protein YoaR
MRVNYFDEAGALIFRAEYPRNYRGITHSEAVKVLNRLKGHGYGATDAADEIFRGFKRDMEKLRAAYCYPPKDARAFFYPDAETGRKFQYAEGEDGAIIDEDATVAEMLKGMPKNRADITVKVLKAPPKITASRLKELTARRAAFSTGYSSSKPERKYNIALAAGFISGTVVPPDGIFSFNEVVGRRTAERGFQTAPIIFDGQLVEGVGGGVCQVSTTVYNAALYADLEIIHAKKHSSVVGYAKPSFDAMVSEYNDLKIKNNTGFPLYIAANADGNRLKIEFFGKPVEKGLKIALRSEVKKVVNCEDKVILNDGSYEISEEGFFRISRGANGCVSEGYIDYYRGGVLERSEKIRSDTYRPMNGVIVKDKESAYMRKFC